MDNPAWTHLELRSWNKDAGAPRQLGQVIRLGCLNATADPREKGMSRRVWAGSYNPVPGSQRCEAGQCFNSVSTGQSYATRQTEQGRFTVSARKNYTKKDVTKMVSAYKKGSTLAQLGDEYGASITTIRTLLLAQGVTMRPRGKVAAAKPKPAQGNAVKK